MVEMSDYLSCATHCDFSGISITSYCCLDGGIQASITWGWEQELQLPGFQALALALF
jgi:hypothetical protein